ncbi:hypothetical protein SFOMI_0161 [Sphingobium fuliginis]|uniref:Uncharacterized protein n=1 Tax=Sphingobium fuliginis (strain ATCC 27551) TaxID=336203 RepID=A0A292Z9T5_SPHSA|nr:hypothetical protein SFOMI_0161 [Sphingobium fuliginis]
MCRTPPTTPHRPGSGSAWIGNHASCSVNLFVHRFRALSPAGAIVNIPERTSPEKARLQGM